MGGFVELIREVAPAAAPIRDGPAPQHAPVCGSATDGLFLIVPAKGVRLPHGIGHQTIRGAWRVHIEELVLVVVLFVPVRARAALLQHHHRKAGHRQLLGHDAPGGSGTDDDKINFGCWLVLDPIVFSSPDLSDRVADGVVVAEWRLEIQRVVEPDQFPADLVVVAAVRRTGKHAGNRVRADRREERSILDGREELDLLRRGQRRELAGAGKKFLRLRLQVFQPLRVDRLSVAEESCQRAVDEVDAMGLVRARGIVGGNDLGRHRIDIGGLLAGEEGEMDRLPRSGRLRMRRRIQDSRPVRGQPDGTQPRSRPNKERSS